MQQKINAIFTKRVLELNGSLGFNDSLGSCNRALIISLRGENDGGKRADFLVTGRI